MAIVMKSIKDKQYFFITDGTNIFKAYTNEGMNLSFNNEFKDAINEVLGQDLFHIKGMEIPDVGGRSLSTLATAITNQAGAGYVPNFDMPRYYGYTGMAPITWSIKGYLPLVEGSEKDFKEPITALGNMALPHRSTMSFTDFCTKVLGIAKGESSPDIVRSAAGMVESGFPVVEGVLSAIFQWDNISEADKSVYPIEVPTMIKQQVAFYWGHKEGTPGIIRLQPCIIKSVALNAPAPSIAGSDGKIYPAYIEVSLTMEYARTPTDAILKDYMYGTFTKEELKTDLAAKANEAKAKAEAEAAKQAANNAAG